MTMIQTEFERDELTELNRFNPYLKASTPRSARK